MRRFTIVRMASVSQSIYCVTIMMTVVMAQMNGTVLSMSV